MTGPLAPRVVVSLWGHFVAGFKRFRRFRGWWWRPSGDEYKVSVTRLAFCIIWYDKHSADWLAALASPYPAAPDCPRLQEKGGGASHQRGNLHRPQGGCMVFRRAKPGCPVFAAKGGIKNGAHEGAHLASAAILHTSRGRKPGARPGGVSRSRTEPLAPRAVRPGGAINPHARKGASTFGNTGKRRFRPKSP